MEAWFGSLKTITYLDSRNGEETNSPAKCLIVVVIRVAVEIERARGACVGGKQERAVGDIESVIRACRADRKSSANLRAYRYIWQDVMVDTNRSVRQFVDLLRLEAFDENITRTEEFSGAEGDVIVKKIRDLGVYKVHVGAATTGLDLQPAVE